jgi:hypothetical protein
MGFWKKLFGGGEDPPADATPEQRSHAVEISIQLAGTQANADEAARLERLASDLGAALVRAGTGVLVREPSEAYRWRVTITGADADEIWESIERVLEGVVALEGSYAKRRYGRWPGARSEDVDLHFEG